MIRGLVFLGLAACSSPQAPPDAGGSPSGECAAALQRACTGWRCASAFLISRSPAMQPTGTLSGPLELELASVNGQDPSSYLSYVVTVRRAGQGVEVQYQTFSLSGDECSLTTRLSDSAHATLTWNGVELDGYGALTAEERAALDSFASSRFVDGVVGAALEAGCQADVPPEYEAALLFPFQLMLKYDRAPGSRGESLKQLLAASACRYLSRDRVDEQPNAARGPLLVESGDPIPHVWDYTPFDAVGASDPGTQPLEGDLWGPCTAKCRGACGADCPKSNCAGSSYLECPTDGGVAQSVELYDCGVHDGCVEHDNCFDDCNATKGCNTWAAFFCMRGCDRAAGSKWGVLTGLGWAGGSGPYQRRVQFEYRTPVSSDLCTCVTPTTRVRLADGSSVPISEVTPGTTVAAWDVERRRATPATVEQVYRHVGHFEWDRVVVAGGQVLEVTGNHPVYTTRGFVPAAELKVGDVLMQRDPGGKLRRQVLVSITRRVSSGPTVYNLKTTAGNYFANDLLIHNKCFPADTRVETQRGVLPVSQVQPGDLVPGERDGQRVWTPVLAVYRKSTVLESLPGKQLRPGLAVTNNHVLAREGAMAAGLPFAPVDIAGDVFDVETETGNLFVQDVLLKAEP